LAIRYFTLGAAAVALTAPAFAQTTSTASGFDGLWKGTVNQADAKLVVKGAKGDLTVTCQTAQGQNDIKIGQDGTLSGYVKTGSFRREVSGKLPELSLGGGGSCGGSTTLTR